MSRRGWVVLGLVGTLLLTVVSGAALLLLTETGLHVALQLAQRVAPGTLTWQQADGRLVGPVQLAGVDYQDDKGHYRLGRLRLDWAPGRLLARRLSVHRLYLEDVDINLPETPPDPDKEPFEPGWRLPLELVLRDLAVKNLRVQIGQAEPVVINALNANASSGLEWLDIAQLQLDMPQLALRIEGRLGLGREVGTDLSLAWRLTPEGYAPIAARGQLNGTWEQAILTQQFETPMAARARIEIQQPFSDLHWALELDTPVTRLTAINADWPEQQIGARLQGEGTLSRGELNADLQTDWTAQTLYPLRVELSVATGADGNLQVRPLLLRQGDSQVRLTGNWSAETERFNARLDAQRFRWPLIGTPVVQIPAGELEIAGSQPDYQLKVAARLVGKDVPAADLQGNAQGDKEGLRLENLEARTLEGVLRAQGQVSWAPQLAWDVELDAKDINPGQHWPAWPGKLAAQLQSTGSKTAQGLTLEARIAQLSGDLRGYPVSGRGALHLQDDTTRIESVHLQSGDAQLDLNGTLAETWDLDWVLRAPDLRQLAPTLAGAVDAKGSLSGPRAQPRLQAHATARDFAAANARLAALQLDADLSLRPGAALSATARGKDLRLAERRFDTLALNLDGTLERQVIDLQAQGETHKLNLAAQGGWNGTHWRGQLRQADWRLPELGAWTLQKPVQLNLSAGNGAVENACWQQLPAKLCAEFNYRPAERQLHAELSDWPLAQLQTYFPPDVRIEASTLTAKLNARLPAQGTARATAQVRLTPGTLNWNDAGRDIQTPLGGGDGDLNLDGEGLRGQLQLRLSGADQISLQAQLPGYRLDKPPATQTLNGQLRGAVRDFAVVNALSQAVDNLSGVLRLDGKLAGTLSAPAMRGELRLSEGRGFIGPAGVQIEDWQLTLAGDPLDGRLRLQSSARSGPGTVQLNGWLAHLGSADLEGELRVGGTGFEAVNLPEARVLVTPDLLCKVSAQSASISGSLHIPEARIEPRDLSGAVTPSKDVVLVHQAEPPAPGWTLNSRVQLSLGDRVHFDGFGLNGQLTGGITLIDETQRVPLANGELAIKSGVYKVYGQELKIEQGRVLYRDSPLDNPALDIRAVRKTGDVLAGVRVLGTAKDPVAELYSQPSMAQADVLSYLMLGRPVANASGSEGELLFKAASSLGLKGGNALAQNIGNAFGLDEVAVGGGDDLESAALTVGKYLSPRLYINYSVGLLDAANRLQMRYELSKRISVQTETGTATGGDILYTIER